MIVAVDDAAGEVHAMAMSRSFRIARERGPEVTVAGRRLVPVALVASGRLVWRDRIGWAFAWARPLAVEVHDGSRVQSVPVPDLRLWGTVGMAAVASVGAVVATVVAKSFRRRGANE